MIKLSLLFLLAFAVTGCALYTEIPEEYLAPKQKEIEKPAAAKPAPPVQTIQQPAETPKKNYPDASSSILIQFTEEEKEILASRVYEVLFDASPVPETKIALFPDLRRYGNKVTIEAYTSYGRFAEKSGAGGSLLDNVTEAAEELKQDEDFQKNADEMYEANLLYFTITLEPVALLAWGKELRWKEIIDDRYYLPITELDPQLVQGRWISNRHFMRAYWPHLEKLFKGSAFPLSSIAAPWLSYINLPQAADIPSDTGTQLIKDRLIAKAKIYDPELSYVAASDGRIDLKSTALLALLLLKTEEWNDVVAVLEPLISTLLFLQNEDGSLQAGIIEEDVLAKDNEVVPLILEIYFLLGKKGDEAFQEAFRSSFSYYFPMRLKSSNQVSLRLAWGYLLLAVARADKDKEGQYLDYLDSFLSGFFNQIPNPSPTKPAAQGSFNWKDEGDSKSKFKAFNFIVSAYSLLKAAGSDVSTEKWDVKMLFTIRYFLNAQIMRPDILWRSIHEKRGVGWAEGVALHELLGSFFSAENKSLMSPQDQLWAAGALSKILPLWNSKEWEEIKEKGEALI